MKTTRITTPSGLYREKVILEAGITAVRYDHKSECLKWRQEAPNGQEYWTKTSSPEEVVALLGGILFSLDRMRDDQRYRLLALIEAWREIR